MGWFGRKRRVAFVVPTPEAVDAAWDRLKRARVELGDALAAGGPHALANRPSASGREEMARISRVEVALTEEKVASEAWGALVEMQKKAIRGMPR